MEATLFFCFTSEAFLKLKSFHGTIDRAIKVFSQRDLNNLHSVQWSLDCQTLTKIFFKWPSSIEMSQYILEPLIKTSNAIIKLLERQKHSHLIQFKNYSYSSWFVTIAATRSLCIVFKDVLASLRGDECQKSFWQNFLKLSYVIYIMIHAKRVSSWVHFFFARARATFD